ncbi:MAG: hypothetical protein JSU66_08015 [Deltaproteobacteria bacterium]|nr:MAG: hypothetical protein JSU66_08015 [Deltaproteobacteria bacterium]
MPEGASGYSKAGQANPANDNGEVAYGNVTFTPQIGSCQLVACGTANCKAPGTARVRVEYKQGMQPWQPAGISSGAGSGRVALAPSSEPVELTPGEPCEIRVVIEGANTETSPAEDFFSITLLELEPEEI